MTPVHFMGREIGYWATDRFGFCRYRSLRNYNYWRDLARANPFVFLPEWPHTRERLIFTDRDLGI